MAYNIGITWIEETDSTNSEVLRHIDEIDNLSVIAAVNQTAGRGQRGNVWKSAPGDNLTFSLMLKFGEGLLSPLKTAEQFSLTCMMTVSVRKYLEQRSVETKIKWPNDIYAGNRKLCGMLIENKLAGPEVACSVIGVGLNLNQTDFPGDLLNPTSMSKITGKRYDLKAELEALMEITAAHIPLLYQPSLLRTEYVRHLYRLGRWHDYVDCASGETFSGCIAGIDPEGHLKVKLKDGSDKQYAFKEISYII